MTNNTLKCLGKLSLSLLLAVSLNGAAFAGVAPVEGSACALQPHADAAVVMKLMGMVNNRTEKSLSGIAYTINDGIVIRQSYIKDGKIIIPSEGLYTVSRGSSFMPLDNSPVSINGKTWRTVAYTYNRDIVRNIKMKKGDLVFTDANKTRGWALTSVGGIAGEWSKSNEASATFQIRKVTGNYYGSSFPVTAGKMTTPAAADGSLMKGSQHPEGNTYATGKDNLDSFLISSNTFTTGRSFVVIDKIDDDGTVHVRELSTDSTNNIWVTPNNPVVNTYANGGSFEIGGAKVTVKNITKNSAEVTIADKAGSVTKTLSFDPEVDKWFPMSQDSIQKALAFSKGGDVAVHLNVVPGAPFKDGKVELVAYNEVTNLENGSDWITDNRFLARPDSWASCTFPHEIIVTNKEQIVLDGGANNVFVGPDKQFKIVIDEFDGKTVKAWHIETEKAKTGNLAVRAEGKHIDLVVGKACRSTVHFIKNWYAKLIDETMQGKNVLN